MNKVLCILVKNLTSGGAEKQSILLAKALSGLHQVHYVVLNAKYQEPKYLQLLKESPNIHYMAFEGNFISRFWQFCVYLKKNRVEYIFSYLTAANFFAIVASTIAGVKNVFTGIRNAYLPPVKMFIDRFLCNIFASKAVLNCYSGEKYFRDKGFKRSKIVVIPNCFENISNYQHKQKEDELIRIISVGRFVEQKDYFTALNVIKHLSYTFSNIRYQIIGYGELEVIIREKVVELKLDNVVEIFINPKNISGLLSRADIYLSTSTFEGTSNSIMEAMNSDLPIVATNVGDNDQLIIDNKNGYLCTVKDTVDIANKLILLIENQQKRIEMGKASKQHLLDNFSMEKFTKSYVQLIESSL